MRVRELIGSAVTDAGGERIGFVADLHLERDGGDYVVAGLRVAHGREKNLFGYEREEAGGPALVRWLFRLLHRGDRIVPWSDVAAVGADGAVRLRPTSST